MKNLYKAIAKHLENEGEESGDEEVFVLYQRILMLLESVKAVRWNYEHARPSSLVSCFSDIISILSAEYKKMNEKTAKKFDFDE